MAITRYSPAKVNLVLNILGKRPDGFHELETVIQPVAINDVLEFQRGGKGVWLTCNLPEMRVDSSNLVHRAATAFLDIAGISDGLQIRLEKQIPLAAGLGGGSSNAATTLLALNELFGYPLGEIQMRFIAESLGSDVPFFLQPRPAFATGRGERIVPLDAFPALRGVPIVLFYPGFGISTAWAYRQLAHFPAALNSRPGWAQELISALRQGDLGGAGQLFYNSLEAPALKKFPILALYQEFFRAEGAAATLMSGSGSTTFALATNETHAERLKDQFCQEFGREGWFRIAVL